MPGGCRCDHRNRHPGSVNDCCPPVHRVTPIGGDGFRRADYQVFGGNSGGPGLTLTTTPTLLATLTLDTIGASLGTYTIGLSSLFAADTQGDDMRVGALTNPALTYKIVAASVTPTPGVPEPASAALALLALAALGQQRRQARRA